MKLEDLKVIDIIQMPQFEKHIEALIKDLYLTRTKIVNEYPGAQFKRGPIERLQGKKVFGPKALAALYAKVVDKTINTSEYPSTLRTFIKGIGDEAFLIRYHAVDSFQFQFFLIDSYGCFHSFTALLLGDFCVSFLVYNSLRAAMSSITFVSRILA